MSDELDELKEAAERAKGAAGAAEHASANVQTVAAATEELSATTGEIAQQVNVSAATAEKAAGEADLADRRIQALAETAAEIGEVVLHPGHEPSSRVAGKAFDDDRQIVEHRLLERAKRLRQVGERGCVLAGDDDVHRALETEEILQGAA